MTKTFDGLKYPRLYQSSEVITNDQNGYPLLTRFYSGLLQLGDVMFEWVQQFYASLVILAEAFTSSYGVAVTLAHPNIVSGSEIVSSSTATFVKGVDYTMDYINGKITALKVVAAISAESFTSVFDTPVSLAHANLDASVLAVVATVDQLTIFTAGTDYTIDYATGAITVLSTGTMLDATAYHIDYTYITGMLDATSYNVDYDYMDVNSIGREQKWSLQNINTSV